MKKWISGLGFLGILLSVPYSFGVRAKQNLEMLCEYLNQQDAMPYHLELKNYQEGWFSSTAKLKVSLPPSSLLAGVVAAKEQFPLVGDLVIHHGPIIVLNNGRGLPKVQFARSIIDSTINLPSTDGQKKLIQGTSVFQLMGNLSNDIDFRLGWLNAHLSNLITRDVRIKNISYNLAITVPDSSSIKFNLNLKRGAYGLWLIDFDFGLNNLIFSEEGKPVFSIFGAKASQRSKGDANTVTTSINYQDLKIEAYGKSYGPSTMMLQLVTLPAKELKSISGTIHDINIHSITEEKLSKLSAQLSPDLLNMMNNSPTIDFSFSTKTSEGDVNIKLYFHPPKNALSFGIKDRLRESQGQGSFSMPKLLLKKLLANEAKIAIDAQITESAKESGQQSDFSRSSQLADEVADKHLATLEQDGWISAMGENYVGTYEYKDGKIFSNGKLMIDVLERVLN